MSDKSVESVVESMVKEAPVTKTVEKTSPEAPAKKTPDEPAKVTKEVVTADDTTKGNDGLTAFDTELINELESDERTEFDGLTETEKTARLKWMKTRYRKDARSKTELGSLRKVISTLRDANVTDKDLLALINSKKSGKPVDKPSGDQKITKRGLASLLTDDANAEDRETITKTGRAIREEIEDIFEELSGKKIKPLEDRLDANDQRRSTRRSSSLEVEINDLEDKHGYPGSLIETYRDEIKSLGIRNPDYSAEELLFKVAPPSLLKKTFKAPSNGEVTKPVSKVVKQTSTENTTPKNSKDRTSISKAIDRLFN